MSDYINSKMLCPVCNRDFAKNYLLVHLTKQHSNIFGTPEWESSRYSKNYEKIKKDHKDFWKPQKGQEGIERSSKSP
jgi:hypothetical protein